MQADLHSRLAGSLAPILSQLTPQQKAQLLSQLSKAPVAPAPAPPVPAAPAQLKREQMEATVLASMTTMVADLAATVRDLSALPGADKYISPDMATVVHRLASTRPQHPLTYANNKTLDACTPGPISSLDSGMCRQRPETPPALLRASAQHSPVTPTHMPAQALVPSPHAMHLRSPDDALLPFQPSPGALIPVQGLQDTAPPATFQARQQPAGVPSYQSIAAQLRMGSSSLSTTDSSSDSKAGGSPSKRACKGTQRASEAVQAAQRALAAVMGLQQHQPAPVRTSLAPVSTVPASPTGLTIRTTAPCAAPAAGSTNPSSLALPAQRQQYEARLLLAGLSATSVHEILRAADIIFGMHSDTLDPQGFRQDVQHEEDAFPKDPCSLAPMQEEHGAKAAPAPAAAARKPGRPAAKAPVKRGRQSEVSHFQCEAEDVSEETKAALMLMWATQEGLPVFCENHTSGVRVTGTFKIIDGRRKIVTSDGTIMEPVDFEKAGDRATTRNWQLSICVTGLNAKSGSRTELKLGHATRILGVHNITQPNSPMASR